MPKDDEYWTEYLHDLEEIESEREWSTLEKIDEAYKKSALRDLF